MPYYTPATNICRLGYRRWTRWGEKKADRCTDRQTDRQTDRYTDIQRDRDTKR